MKNKNIQMKREDWENLREYQKHPIKERYLKSLSVEERREFEKNHREKLIWTLNHKNLWEYKKHLIKESYLILFSVEERREFEK